MKRVADSIGNSANIGRVPPHKIEAEMSVLGAMLLGDNAAVSLALEMLSREDFYRETHSHIFDAMASLSAKRSPVDIITLQHEMDQAGTLEGIGIEYLMQLSDVEFTTSNLAHYAKIVKEMAILRRVIESASLIAGQAYKVPEDVEAFAADSVTRMMQAAGEGVNPSGGYKTLWEMMTSLYASLEERWNEGGIVPGMSTGFADLDHLTGGFKKGDLVIIAGRPAMGKTAFICYLLALAAKRGERVLFASLEMTREQVALRMLSAESRVDSSRIESGNYDAEEGGRMTDAARRLFLDNLLTDDEGSLSASVIIMRARRAAAAAPVDCVVVDYLQEAASEDGQENRTVEVARNARAFKALAKELNCPVIVLSQLSRAVERREDKRPMLSDLYESGAIEAAADVVMSLYRPGYYALKDAKPLPEGQPEEIEISVLKNRKGKLGMVPLNYFLHWSRFEELYPAEGL